MGYPMTWKRLINRNGLDTGSYEKVPVQWALRVNMNDEAPAWAAEEISKARKQRLQEYERALKLFAGDLRRLEKDAVDEDGSWKLPLGIWIILHMLAVAVFMLVMVWVWTSH